MKNTYSGHNYSGARVVDNLPTALVGKTVAVGLRIYSEGYGFYTNNAYAGAIIGFRGPEIYIANTNPITIYRGGTLIGTASAGIALNTFRHIEVLLFSDGSAGTVTIKVEGTEVYAGTSLNTGGDDITGIQYSSDGKSSTYRRYDDIYYADELQGQLTMTRCSPVSDDSCDFTPSTGSDNYAMVDDTGQDGDSTYNQSSTLNNKDIFNYEDLDNENIEIKAISIVTVAKKIDAGDRSITHKAVQDSTEYDQTEFELTDSYKTGVGVEPYIDVLPTCPDGSSWTPTKFQSIKFGYEITV